MRPAQKAPENLLDVVDRLLDKIDTSMRPAQKAPENGRLARGRSAALVDFNEAGAKSAGKRLTGGAGGLAWLSLQ